MSQMMKRTASKASKGDDYNARFREIIDREFPTLEGRQVPQSFVCAEGGDFTHGERAIELARRFGIVLMPWQRDQVLYSLAQDADGKWLHPDIVLLCPRQNGKSLILEVIMLYRFFILGHQIVFSAHQWRTAKSIRNRIWRRIKSKPWAARRLVRNTASAGEAEMETAEGGKIQFTTRSNDMGRGFDEIDLLLLDEAYNLESGELDAVAPTQLAAADPQTYYTSSAVNKEKHAKGEELSRVRERALGDENEGILFSEFCAPEGMDRDDPLTWRLSNPSFGFPKLVDDKKMRSMRAKLTDTGFDVEMIGWGQWFSRAAKAETALVDLARWSALQCDEPVLTGDACMGVDVTPDGEHIGMVSAQRAGDSVFVKLAELDDFTRDGSVQSIKANVDLNDPLGVVIDPSGPAGTVVDPLRRVGVEPECLSGGKVAAAYELLLSLVREGKLLHDGDPRFLAAWEVAKERGSNSKFRSFERYSGNIACLVALSFAVWGLQEFEIPEEAPIVESKKRYVGSARPVMAATATAPMSF